MKMASGPFARRYFDTLHPLTLLCYFVYALIPAMSVSHPVLQTAAVMCGMLLLFAVTGFRAARTTLLFCIPAAAFCMLINALFTHRGITVLFYFPSGNPCTLESLLSGLSLGMTLLSAMLFFAVLSRVMTPEKLSVCSAPFPRHWRWFCPCPCAFCRITDSGCPIFPPQKRESHRLLRRRRKADGDAPR